MTGSSPGWARTGTGRRVRRGTCGTSIAGHAYGAPRAAPFSRVGSALGLGCPGAPVEWITDRMARSWPGRITSELAAVSGPAAAKGAGAGRGPLLPRSAWEGPAQLG